MELTFECKECSKRFKIDYNLNQVKYDDNDEPVFDNVNCTHCQSDNFVIDETSKHTLLKSAVLRENNAQFIYNHIRDLENKSTIHGKRWFWELLQNAKDTVGNANEEVKVIVEVNENNLIFKHTGNKFSEKEILHLILHGSTKKDDETKTGKFGTGFMTTHLLSKKVWIKGELKDAKNFNFCLDRAGSNPNELEKNLANSLNNLKQSFSQKTEQTDDYHTQFTYIDISNKKEEIINPVLENLKEILPFVLATNDKIEEVKIINDDTNFTLKKTDTTNKEGNFKTVTVSTDENETLKILCFYSEPKINYKKENKEIKEKIKLIISIELNNNDEIKEIDAKIPRFFYDFPLFSTEKFHIPFVINSLDLIPETEREGIYLTTSETPDIFKNKAILHKVFENYITLLQFSIRKNYKNIHFLVNFKMPEPDLDGIWYKNELIKKFIKHIFKEKIAFSNKNSLIALENAIIPYTTSDEIEPTFWEICETIYPEKIISKDLQSSWKKIVDNWREFFDENDEFLFVCKIDDIADLIGKTENLEGLSKEYFSNDKDKAIEWLNKFLSVVIDGEELNTLKNKIILNQNNTFVEKNLNLKIDNGIDEDLKTIFQLLDKDIKYKLINTQITAFKDEDIFQEVENETVYDSAIGKVKNIGEYSKDKMKLSLIMLRYLIKNEKLNDIDGLPVFVKPKDNNHIVHKLSHSNKLLAPIENWDEEYRDFSELFNDEHILSLSCDNFKLSKEEIDILEKQGYIYLNPLYKEKHVFKKEDFKLIATSQTTTSSSLVVDDDSIDDSDIPEIEVSKIPFFNNDFVIKKSRSAKKNTKLLLEFLLTCVIKKHPNSIDYTKVTIGSETYNVYPSLWLAKLKSNQWVNVEIGKSEPPTSSNLSKIFEKNNNLFKCLKDETVTKFLNIIGVGVSDLKKNIIAKGDEETMRELDKTMSDMLSLVKDKEGVKKMNKLLQKISDEADNEANIRLNQVIGGLIEKLFKDVIQNKLNNLGLSINKVSVGRDFDIAFDYVNENNENILSLNNNNIKYLIKLKSTTIDKVSMTKDQGIYSKKNKTNFALCVIKHGFSVEAVNDNDKEKIKRFIKDNMRFVPNIGEQLEDRVSKVNEYEDKLKETRIDNDNIETHITNGEIKYNIKKAIWEKGLEINGFISHLRDFFQK